MGKKSKKGIRRVLFPGSFDPLHNGHVQIIERACKLFDEVVVAVLNNPVKLAKEEPVISLKERAKLIKKVFENNPQIKVVFHHEINTFGVAKRYKCDAIIRGIRGTQDIKDEDTFNQIIYEESDGTIDVLYLMCLEESNPGKLVVDTSTISSTIIREKLKNGEDIFFYCPLEVVQRYKKEFENNGK